jgi:hypothetical protein
MNEINKEEMFGHLKGFLKSKGIEIREGAYVEGIRKGCEILTETVNLSQRALERAKDAMEQGLDPVRETFHERTGSRGKTGNTPKASSAGTKKRPQQGAGNAASARTAAALRAKKKSQ